MSNSDKNNNNKNVLNTEKGSNFDIGHISNLAILKDKGFNLIFNKTEKVSTALYMITNFMSAQEPLKWHIRDASLKMLNSVMSLNKTSLSGRDVLMREITGNLFEVKSLFGIAYRSGFISVMNFEIVDGEIRKLIEFLASYDSDKISINTNLFSKEFWDSENLPVDKHDAKQFNDFYLKDKKNINNKTSIFLKDNKEIKDVQHIRIGQKNKGQIFDQIPNFVIKDIKASKLDYEISKKAKEIKISNRREKIIKIVTDLGQVSVKDIAERVDGCSEKTLQRELLNLVNEGVLKKDGERRWSRYSLK